MLTGKAHFDYYKNERGFDPTVKGAWQTMYVAMIDRVFRLKDRRILDVGAACGAQTSAMRDLGLDAWGIEPEEYFVRISPFENMRGRLLHAKCQLIPFRDRFFDFIQAHQVFEHIPAGECAEALTELAFVAQPGAILYASLQVESGKPHDPKDDVTHINYQTMDWWEKLLPRCGWELTHDYDAALESEPMQRSYHWDYFVAVKRGAEALPSTPPQGPPDGARSHPTVATRGAEALPRMALSGGAPRESEASYV